MKQEDGRNLDGFIHKCEPVGILVAFIRELVNRFLGIRGFLRCLFVYFTTPATCFAGFIGDLSNSSTYGTTADRFRLMLGGFA
jgi:hypothetical protein